MGTRLYVGNLPYGTDDKQLRALFDEVGQVPREVRIITDRVTGQSRGFAFVEVQDGDAAQACITALNGRAFGGRTLTVNEARERQAGGGPGGGGPGGERRNGGPGGYAPREGARPPREFSGPPRPPGGGPPRDFGNRNSPGDRERDRDRFERKKLKRRRDYGDDDY